MNVDTGAYQDLAAQVAALAARVDAVEHGGEYAEMLARLDRQERIDAIMRGAHLPAPPPQPKPARPRHLRAVGGKS